MSMFRANALRNFMQGNEETVLPRFVAPRVFVYLWLLLGLLVLSTGMAWHTQYPVYYSTLALVEDHPGKALTLVVLLSPGVTIAAGQPVLLTLDGQRTSVAVREVIPQVLSPHAIRERFELGPEASLLIMQPAQVALVEAPPGSLPGSVYRGSVFQADVEVGSERVIASFPVIGDLFEE